MDELIATYLRKQCYCRPSLPICDACKVKAEIDRLRAAAAAIERMEEALQAALPIVKGEHAWMGITQRAGTSGVPESKVTEALDLIEAALARKE